MQSTIQLYNTALARLGGDYLEFEQSPEENNVLVALCNNQFPHVLDLALSACAWSFARRRVELAERVDRAPVSAEYPLRYGLPRDCLRVLHLEGWAGVNERPFWVIEGPDLMTAASPAVLSYIARVADPRQWPAAFADALAWGLASELATARINDVRRQQAYLQKYELALSEAIARDRNSQHPDKAQSPWVISRGNRGTWRA